MNHYIWNGESRTFERIAIRGIVSEDSYDFRPTWEGWERITDMTRVAYYHDVIVLPGIDPETIEGYDANGYNYGYVNGYQINVLQGFKLMHCPIVTEDGIWGMAFRRRPGHRRHTPSRHVPNLVHSTPHPFFTRDLSPDHDANHNASV